MKRLSLLLAVTVLFCRPARFAVRAADDAATRAAAIAAQQDFEERYKRLLSDVEDLKDGLATQQKRMSEILKDMQRLEEDTTRSQGRFATR
jgi:hypothetical protein